MFDFPDSIREFSVARSDAKGRRDDDDRLAVEEPMEIRVVAGTGVERKARSLSVTMRTPGHDFELAAGFLLTEGILQDAEQIEAIEFCGPAAPGRSTSNIVRVKLIESVQLDIARLQRHFFTTSSCGICGKASLDALDVQGLQPLPDDDWSIPSSVVHRLPAALRAEQPLFDSTGGLHAAALADVRGEVMTVREDVGRHNAVDKVIGRRMLDGEVSLSTYCMVVSGRASFEILQKALVARLPMIVAVGAPSSLAVDMAERFGMTLVGFASQERFNIYTGSHRIIEA